MVSVCTISYCYIAAGDGFASAGKIVARAIGLISVFHVVYASRNVKTLERI